MKNSNSIDKHVTSLVFKQSMDIDWLFQIAFPNISKDSFASSSNNLYERRITKTVRGVSKNKDKEESV
jgi:hypothetical protein